MKLVGKIFINGKIKLETGLHIGGSKTALDIGGIDLNIIKTSESVPFIPGSSLKGKLRSLLAREYGSFDVKDDIPKVKELFGEEAPSNTPTGQITRLLVRDSFMNPESKSKLDNREEEFKDLELKYTETKWENTIDRKSGTAQHPRQLERVPAGAVFNFELVYNEFDDLKTNEHISEIKKAMRLLEDDYIGGSGSRGYGKIKFIDVIFEKKDIPNYEKNNQRELATYKW
ncbi:MAG: type III-A CRISPR-associated RAMP protein Csm3 [Melioribacter sp.]|nr:type III-A CRISPR-associated RAMP protein Csm3 [Melioribacter sp.]